MKKILSGFLAFVMAFGIFCSVPFTESPFKFTVNAASVDDLTFKLNDDGESYRVSDCETSASGDLTIPSTYNDLPVTSIGWLAFSYCEGLTSVTIGSGVTSIDVDAFYYCTSLTSITIPNGVTSIGEDAFYNTAYYNNADNWENGVLYIGNHLITARISINGSYVIKSGTKTIADDAFYGCTSLTTVTIPDSVTSIGEGAFYGCKGLTSVAIPDSVTSIGYEAFSGCTSLTTVTIPDSVTSIGNDAFRGCTSLTSINVDAKNQYYSSLNGVLFNKDKTELIQYPIGKTDTQYTIPDSVTSIGNYAFEDCTSLTSVTIPDSVTSISNSAFGSCTGLTSITIPDSVMSIGGRAFEDCTNLKSVTIGNGVTSIGGWAFDNTAYYNNADNWENGVLYIGNHLIEAKESINGSYVIKSGTKTIADYALSYCTSLTSITIPDSVTSIGDSAFYNCKNLKSLTIPDGVTSIGNCAFEDCTSLTSVTIPDSVTSIGDYAFYGCTGLTSVTIPDSVTDIGNHAFGGCTNLKSVTIGNGVTSIGGWAFDNTAYYNNADNWENVVLYIGNHLIEARTSISGTYVIKSGTKTIADYALSYCTSLTSITIPDSVTSIGSYAFGGCTSLTSVTIPDSVTSIGYEAFGYYGTLLSGYSKVKNFTIYGKSGSATEAYAEENGFNFVETSKMLPTPTLVSISNLNGGVYFKWNTVSGADGYYIYRKVGNGNWEKLVEIEGGSRYAYTDASAKAGYNYTYTVAAYKGTDVSSYDSDGLYIKRLTTPQLLGVSNSNGGIYLKWNSVYGASGYQVYRKVGNGGWIKIATLSGNSKISYSDATVKAGYNYKYTVRAYFGNVLSYYNTNGLAIKRLTTPKLVSVSNLNNGIYLKWNSVYGASGYQIYRKTGNGGWVKIATISGGSKVAYTDSTAKSGYNYKYTVRAYFGSLLSYYNTAGLAIKRLIAPKLTGVTSAKAGVTVKWNKTYGATGYQVYRKTGNGGWVKIATVSGGSKVSYLDKTAKKGVTYTYTVRAYYGSSLSYYNTKGLKITDRY